MSFREIDARNTCRHRARDSALTERNPAPARFAETDGKAFRVDIHTNERRDKNASLPARIIDKGLASDRVVIDTIVSKYADHVPLYRQSAILERETGIEIPRATLDGWVMRVGELLRPITAAMGQELLKGDYIQADETPVDVQMHDGRGKNHQAYSNGKRCCLNGWNYIDEFI